MKVLIFALALSLAACGIPGTPEQASDVETVLTQLGDTLIADLQQQRAVALAATPADMDGVACVGRVRDPTIAPDTGTGMLAVADAIQRVAAVTKGKHVGAFTVAEIMSLYQPGSEQFNWAVKTLESACIAKVHDVNQAINSTNGVIAMLPTLFALAVVPK